MTPSMLLFTLISVAMICAGQLIFKWIGLQLHAGAPFTQPNIFLAGFGSMLLYGLATLLWIFVLRTTPLSAAYPFMALSFVLVPIGSKIFFSERISPSYAIGLALIVIGVVVTVSFKR